MQLLISCIVVPLIIIALFVFDRKRNSKNESEMIPMQTSLLDKILFVGIAISGIVGGAADGFMWFPVENLEGGFPVFSCVSIFPSYALWIGLMIYSLIKNRTKSTIPKLVRWYAYFLIPFLQLLAIFIGWFIAFVLVKIFC